MFHLLLLLSLCVGDIHMLQLLCGGHSTTFWSFLPPSILGFGTGELRSPGSHRKSLYLKSLLQLACFLFLCILDSVSCSHSCFPTSDAAEMPRASAPPLSPQCRGHMCRFYVTRWIELPASCEIDRNSSACEPQTTACLRLKSQLSSFLLSQALIFSSFWVLVFLC